MNLECCSATQEGYRLSCTSSVFSSGRGRRYLTPCRKAFLRRDSRAAGAAQPLPLAHSPSAYCLGVKRPSSQLKAVPPLTVCAAGQSDLADRGRADFEHFLRYIVSRGQVQGNAPQALSGQALRPNHWYALTRSPSRGNLFFPIPQRL